MTTIWNHLPLLQLPPVTIALTYLVDSEPTWISFEQLETIPLVKPDRRAAQVLAVPSCFFFSSSSHDHTSGQQFLQNAFLLIQFIPGAVKIGHAE